MKKLLLLLVLLPSCSLLGVTDDGQGGLEVEGVAEILRDMANDLKRYDTDGDGVLTLREAAPLGLMIVRRIYQEIRDARELP